MFFQALIWVLDKAGELREVRAIICLVVLVFISFLLILLEVEHSKCLTSLLGSRVNIKMIRHSFDVFTCLGLFASTACLPSFKVVVGALAAFPSTWWKLTLLVLHLGFILIVHFLIASFAFISSLVVVVNAVGAVPSTFRFLLYHDLCWGKWFGIRVKSTGEWIKLCTNWLLRWHKLLLALESHADRSVVLTLIALIVVHLEAGHRHLLVITLARLQTSWSTEVHPVVYRYKLFTHVLSTAHLLMVSKNG